MLASATGLCSLAGSTRNSITMCARPKGKDAGQPRQPLFKREEPDEDIDDEFGEDEDIDLEGEEGSLEDDDDDEGGFLDLDEELDEGSGHARGINLGTVPWAQAALDAAEKTINSRDCEDLGLYLFRIDAVRNKVDIRIDSFTDAYGSPSLDQIQTFSRLFYQELEQKLGLEAAGTIMVEVSSPGADRELQVPEELDRFNLLPLVVDFVGDNGAVDSKILELVEYMKDQGVTVWKLADVKANAQQKGKKLSKKQLALRFNLPVSSIKRVRVHVDI